MDRTTAHQATCREPYLPSASEKLAGSTTCDLQTVGRGHPARQPQLSLLPPLVAQPCSSPRWLALCVVCFPTTLSPPSVQLHSRARPEPPPPSPMPPRSAANVRRQLRRPLRGFVAARGQRPPPRPLLGGCAAAGGRRSRPARAAAPPPLRPPPREPTTRPARPHQPSHGARPPQRRAPSPLHGGARGRTAWRTLYRRAAAGPRLAPTPSRP